ncbi:unnamed protein product, partial [Symbiodinium pilosum]
DLAEVAKDAKAQMDVQCAYYSGNETARTFPVGTSRDCLFNTDRYPATSTRRYIDFLQDQLAWWDKEYMKIRASRELCEQAKEDVVEKERIAAEAKKVFEETREFCSKSQVSLDEASCSNEKAAEQKCSTAGSCVDTNWKIYNGTLTHAKVEETFLQAQMRAVVRIHCYLGIFELSNVSAGIENCKHKDYRKDPNVTAMTFNAHDKPHVPSCHHDLADVAGYCVYEDKYYSRTFGLSDPCTASCCPTGPGCNASTR